MTFAAIAAELCLDERTVRRVLETAFAKLAAGAAAMEADPVDFSAEIATILRVPRRFREIPGDGVEHAPRVVSASPNPVSAPVSSGVGQRAGLLPSRWRPR